MLLGIEDILCELADEEVTGHGFPPGFRFHPTDEELITFYLASKVFHGSLCHVDIAEVDLNKCEPWDLPDVAKMGKREWYFYSLRDRKYPTGLRTNRATATGYWKATGKDKEIHNAAANGALIGMKKTLVFYLGRAPRGQKTKWVMHEYRLHGDFSFRAAAAKEEWVICRICHKTGEKTNMSLSEMSSQFEHAPSIGRKEGFLPQLIDSQLSEQFHKNQASAFHMGYTSNEDIHRTPLLYNSPPEPKLGPFAAYNFQPATYFPTTAIGVNPSTSFSSMLIRSLLSGDIPNNNLIQANSFASEPNFPHVLPGAEDLAWIHDFEKGSSQCNLNAYANGASGQSHTSCIDQIADDVDLHRGGCLQMVVDPNFRISREES